MSPLFFIIIALISIVFASLIAAEVRAEYSKPHYKNWFIITFGGFLFLCCSGLCISSLVLTL